MPSKLVIVESPAKVRTLSGFLGKQYTVAASMGHVRDLPKTKMGVDVENDFEPTYRVLQEKRETIRKLQEALKKCKGGVILATDPDREGEAIAWHLAEALGVENPERIEFHEITKGAVLGALEHPRTIDVPRVNAQQARRILDRLVGYELSPLISRKVRTRGLSAGRVQSVALRLIVEREREILAFIPREYWTLFATLGRGQEAITFTAVHPYSKSERLSIGDEAGSQAVVDAVTEAEWRVREVRRANRKRRPRPPFMTSTLQQAASARYGFSASRTMRVAQSLYEGKDLGGEEGTVGLITYMRTDSTRVATTAQEAAREVIRETYGETYLPAKPPVYATKRGQDAHEAIRPTYLHRTPDSLSTVLDADEKKLYRLIWERFIASQMADAEIETIRADIDAAGYTFRASGSRMLFAGWTAVSGDEAALAEDTRRKSPDAAQSDEDEETAEGWLPEINEGEVLDLRKLDPKQRFTQPPPRYTEAGLIAELEERGIGRPSTYAPTVEVIKQRKYAEIVERRFVPTPLGFVVTDLLVENFGSIVDSEFTAKMEERLDSVEEGALDWHTLLRDFYGDFRADLDRAAEHMVERLPETGEACPECGKPLIMRRGRNGDFVACSGYPDCRYVKREGEEPLETGEQCPDCGKPLMRRRGRFGPFVGCSGYPDCRYIQRTARAEPEKIGMPCPREGCEGEIVRRQSRAKGRVFYGCNAYPKCDFTSWQRPLPRPCPECGAVYIVVRPPGKGQEGLGRLGCAAEGCKWSEEIPDALAEELGLTRNEEES